MVATTRQVHTATAVASQHQPALQSCSTSSSCDVRSLKGPGRFATVLVAGGRRCGEEVDSRRPFGFGSPELLWHHVSSVRRPVLRRSSERPNPASATQEPVTPVSVGDSENLEGVIQVERSDDGPQSSWGRIYALGGGDLVFLLLFAAIGRLSHGMSAFDWEAIRTADPFIAGWLLGCYFVGGYGPEGQGLKGLNVAALSAVKSWAVGVPMGLVIRGVLTGHIPPQPFIVVSLASTFVLQVGWRTAFTALFPNDDKTYQKKKGDRKGNPFEFLELLTSLVRRW